MLKWLQSLLKKKPNEADGETAGSTLQKKSEAAKKEILRSRKKKHFGKNLMNDENPDNQLDHRSILYSKILAKYSKGHSWGRFFNIVFKVIMFAVCMWILCIVTTTWTSIVKDIHNRLTTNNILERVYTRATIGADIALLTAAVIPFITAFVTLPIAIAKNLFDHTDEKTMNEMIKSLLVHDAQLKQVAKEKSEEIRENTAKTTTPDVDDQIDPKKASKEA